MGHFSCVIQQDSAAAGMQDALAERLSAHHATAYPGDEVTVSFREVPTGWMFTEGRQSSSSIIACVFDWETTLAEREAYMRGVCDLWTDATGCTDHEVVVAVTEVDPL